MTNLFQPWILLRILSAITIAFLFVRASTTGLRVLRHFDAARSNEGQLLLERRFDLAATYARVAAFAAALDLGLAVLSADRLSHSLRGAMCAYGVFGANAYGPIALGCSILLAIVGGVLAQLYAFDGLLPRFDLARILSAVTIAVAPLAIIHAAVSTLFLTGLDLSSTASCCSIELDGGPLGNAVSTGAPRANVTALGALFVFIAASSSFVVARGAWSARRLAFASFAAFAASLVGSAAVVLGVAPHAFETPHHLCPFCLLHGDVYGIGYFIFGALYLGFVWSLGATLPTLLAGSQTSTVQQFARSRLRRSGWAWSLALVLGAAPVLRYAWMTGGTLLFQ